MNQNFNNLIVAVLVATSFGLSACGKQSSGMTRVAGTGVIAGGNQSSGVEVTGKCFSGQSTTGKIFDANGNSVLFEQQVKSFVSATLDPTAFGTISGAIADSTGVDMVGVFKFDAAGVLMGGDSSVLIKIFDSYTKQPYAGQTVPPYTIQFGAAHSGSLNVTTKQFVVKFADSYGEITFQGNYDNTKSSGVAEGVVSYVNYRAVTGYSPTSGTLGSFRAYTCALIVQ